MRFLGWVLAASLVLPFIQAVTQLAVYAAIGLALLFALRSPQEALGCMALLVLVGIGQRHPVAAIALLFGLVVIGLREKL